MASLSLQFSPASAARWPDVERLFGERGACGGCWCMVWRLRPKEWTAGKGAKNKRAFKKIVISGEEPGVIGYIHEQPIAWCAIAPRPTYSFLARSRVLSPVDEQPVWSISCLFILKPYRRQGISAQLLRAAVEFAKARGAKIIEGYPTEPSQKVTPDPFLWTGTPTAFRKAGFAEAARRSPGRPIMRYLIEANA
jgi:GNAT superfamily N-acetyltransferase